MVMKSTKGKSKKVYSYARDMKCPRCKCVTRHFLFDAEYGIYKCSICKNIHA